MVARHWRGIVKPGQAEAYLSHLKHDTFPQLESLDGFVSASVMHRSVGEGTEFLVLTIWKSFEDVRAFAGHDIDAAVLPAIARDMMVRYEETVVHYGIATTIHKQSGS